MNFCFCMPKKFRLCCFITSPWTEGFLCYKRYKLSIVVLNVYVITGWNCIIRWLLTNLQSLAEFCQSGNIPQYKWLEKIYILCFKVMKSGDVQWGNMWQGERISALLLNHEKVQQWFGWSFLCVFQLQKMFDTGLFLSVVYLQLQKDHSFHNV